MGGINGDLICSKNYNKFQKQIQEQTNGKGISNPDNFNYRIFTEDKIEILPQGGIGIIDSANFNEVTVECSGVNISLFAI